MLGQIISGKLAAAILAAAVATTGAAGAAALSHTGADNGQGATISALAKSIPGGPGKGAQISAAAKGHGQTVSAAAKAKAKSGKPANNTGD